MGLFVGGQVRIVNAAIRKLATAELGHVGRYAEIAIRRDWKVECPLCKYLGDVQLAPVRQHGTIVGAKSAFSNNTRASSVIHNNGAAGG